MKIGLLPLYIQLYDISSPHVRPRLEGFYGEISDAFEKRGVEVVKTPFCRLKPEFEKAIEVFESMGVDAVVTLHMAYSPSLECIDVLASTHLPIIVLDTTQTFDFSAEQSPAEIMYCHGIHGVMDMCSMLKRYGKAYAIAAGHYLESDCIDRVCGYVRAAVAASALKRACVGLVGGAFEGMGDFAVSREELKERFGIVVEDMDASALAQCRKEIPVEQLNAELEENKVRFIFDQEIDEKEYVESLTDCLAIRRYIEKKKYTAFSVNFQKIGPECGLETMPFMECCKAMERGIGYAGEGDALTAAFTGALLTAYPETGFVEVFCPDWKHDTLFMSHMAEVNYRIVNGKPLLCRKGKDTQKRNAYAAYGCMKGGSGVYVNVSRGKEDYQLLLASAEMLSVDRDNFPKAVRGWMKPATGKLPEFLEELSRIGSTHHSCFVYGASVEELEFFGQILSMKTVTLGKERRIEG